MESGRKEAKLSKMKRMESKKSHSWWWDSHIAPKNKWLQENLEEMDQLVKRMLKMIEEDADSFAKKAELYFKKRPELINLVEEFYRMYRALAERYDVVSGELRKSIPSDIQSQGSGISDTASEPPLATQSTEQRPARRKSGPRAAGFDYFLGSGSEANSKEGDNMSALDSESESDSESDDSSANNSSSSNGEGNGLQRRIVELEAELEEMNEKLKMQKEDNCESCKKHNNESFEVSNKIAGYEEELRVAKEKIQQSEEEIALLLIELQKCKSSNEFELHTAPNVARELHESVNGSASVDDVLNSKQKVQALEEELSIALEKLCTSEKEVESLRHELLSMEDQLMSMGKVQALEEELRVAREKLCGSETEIESLRRDLTIMEDQLKSAQTEASGWKDKLDRENGEASKLQDLVERYKKNLADRDQEISSMTNANKSISEENEQLQAEITRMTKERTYLEDNLKELDLRCQSVEDELRRAMAAKAELKVILGDQIDQLKGEITERDNRVEEVNRLHDELKLKHDALRAFKDELNGKINELSTEISSKDNQIEQMRSHLHQLHMQHVELIAAAETAHKQADDLQARVRELEAEVEIKQEIINEGAERKREAIRQLCFSLEHYRSGYHQLRQAVITHKRPIVMAR